jgi:hypothetical protein
MVRILKVVALVIAVVAISGTPAMAQSCGVLSQIVAHALGGVWDNCGNGRVQGFAFAPGTPATSGTTDIVCEADGEEAQGGPCAGVGTLEDGVIAINGNWSGPGVTGCPNPNGAAGVGRNIVVVRDNNGGGRVVSVGYQVDFAGYVMEAADKADGTPSSCTTVTSNSTCVQIINTNRSGDSTTTIATVEARAIVPAMQTDCEADSQGPAFGTCTETGPLFNAGQVYSRVGRCDRGDLNLATTAGGWTLHTTSPTGDATVARSFASDMCLFIGSSIRRASDGAESTGQTCAAAVAGNLAASPRALAVRAKQDKGDVVIEFHTDTEIGLNGFEIETKSGRKVGGFDAIGVGGAGATYSGDTAIRVKRGDFRGEKEFYVVSVTDNARLKSDLASF